MTRIAKLALAGALPLALFFGGALVGCSTNVESEESDELALEQTTPLELSDAERREIVGKKATCPFVGTAIALKKLIVYGTRDNPLANIWKGLGNAAEIGNAGGGDLGEGFRIVARANHHVDTRGAMTPEGTFSLHFPASKGAHAAHSFILMGDPRSPASGRLDANNLERLIAPREAGGHAERAPNGALVIRRSELGKFVARNVACDPNAITASRKPFAFATMLGRDIIDFNARAFDVLEAKLKGRNDEAEVTKLLEELVTIATGNNLVGSAAELGLLMTFLGTSADATTIDGEPALSVADITHLYAGEKQNGVYDPLTRRFPANWDKTPKTIVSLVNHTLHVLKSAAAAHLRGDYGDLERGATQFPACPITR